MQQSAWEMLLRDAVQGLRIPYTRKPSAGGCRPPTPKHGRSAPARPHQHPSTGAPGRDGAKGRPPTKGQGKVQGEGNTPTRTAATGATHHRSEEPPRDHQHQERERAGATALAKGDRTRTVVNANTHGGGTRRTGRTDTAAPSRTESTHDSLPRDTHRKATMGHHRTRAQAPKADNVPWTPLLGGGVLLEVYYSTETAPFLRLCPPATCTLMEAPASAGIEQIKSCQSLCTNRCGPGPLSHTPWCIMPSGRPASRSARFTRALSAQGRS